MATRLASHTHYAEVVLKKIAQGALPLQPPDRVFGAYGSGQRCNGCEDPVLPHQVEYELHIGESIYRLHLVCFDLLVALRRGQGPVDRSTVLD
jgi:hypothetical protein